MDFGQSASFIMSNGDALERARLRYLLGGERIVTDVLNAVLVGQRADGGFEPPWKQGYSSLDATCYRLALAGQVGLGIADPSIARAVKFLQARQRADGRFEEDETVADQIPQWVKPGDLFAKLYLTANCGYWLAILAESESGGLRAAAYLQAHLESSGALPSYIVTHWLGAGLWYRLGWGEAAGRVLAHLGARLEKLSSGELAWLIIALRTAGMPMRKTLVERAVARLETLQAPDGSWPNDDPAQTMVQVTLDALYALRLCRRSTGALTLPKTDPFHGS
jgi:hypothetical protein